MSLKKRGLGKGLSDLGLNALLGDLSATPQSVAMPHTVMPDIAAIADGELKKLPLTILSPGEYQPRRTILPEALEELANSIRTQGVIQPIVVRPIDNQRYEILAGERRWRAARIAGLEYIPAIIRHINDEAAMILALIENMQRYDLNAIEEAHGLEKLMTQCNMTHQQAADVVGKSRTTVTNLLRLLKLPEAVQAFVEQGQIEMGHARALLALSPDQQLSVAQHIITQRLSVREAELLAQNKLQTSQTHTVLRSAATILHTVQDRLSQKLGVRTTVSQNTRGRGKIVLHFRDKKELEKLVSVMTMDGLE